jgi:hypothetical protein
MKQIVKDFLESKEKQTIIKFKETGKKNLIILKN